MNELTRIFQERPVPTVLEHDQPSRTGKGVPLVNHPKWLTVSQLVHAWGKELPDARTGVYEFEDKLSYHLEKDIINGFLDDPLRNGSRLGVRVIGPGGPPHGGVSGGAAFYCMAANFAGSPGRMGLGQLARSPAFVLTQKP